MLGKIILIYSPTHSVSQGDCVSEGATGYGTQLVLKYLYNYSSQTDVLEEDFKSPKSNQPTVGHSNLAQPVQAIQQQANHSPTVNGPQLQSSQPVRPIQSTQLNESIHTNQSVNQTQQSTPTESVNENNLKS